MPAPKVKSVQASQTLSVAVALLLVACGASVEAEDSANLDALDEAQNIGGEVGPAPAPTQQPGIINCNSLPEYSGAKLGVTATSVSYKRPDTCPGWSGLEAHFTVPASLPYRKLYVAAAFNYVGLTNAKAKCLASKVEYETFRQVKVLGTSIWLPVGQGSVTPIFIDDTEICHWHSYNSESTSGTPGTYVERIRARGVRYNGTIVNVFANARMQAGSLP
jgi:hypothetical protein